MMLPGYDLVMLGLESASVIHKRLAKIALALGRLGSFVDRPHAAIEGHAQGEIFNLTDARAASSRTGQLDLLRDLRPNVIVREFAGLESGVSGPMPLKVEDQLSLPHLVMPAHHDVRPSDVVAKRLHGAIAAAAEAGPADFADLLLVPGVGARTVRALAMVAEVVHGAPYRFSDPARFSFAHGGKDRHPFPVPVKVYDETIRVMKSAVANARLGNDEETSALKRLDEQARKLEQHVDGPSVASLLHEEKHASHRFGGRSVFGWEEAAGVVGIMDDPR